MQIAAMDPLEDAPAEATTPGDVTRLLESASAGDRDALDRVLALLYDDLTQELVATSSVCTDDTRTGITPSRTGKLIKPVP